MRTELYHQAASVLPLTLNCSVASFQNKKSHCRKASGKLAHVKVKKHPYFQAVLFTLFTLYY